MENKCQVCGAEMRTVPAGVSKKTGKPYNSFLACPNKCQQPKKQSQEQQMVMDALVGIAGQIENLNKRMDGLAQFLGSLDKFLKDKFN